MNISIGRSIGSVLLAGLLLGNGCVTHKLWQEKAFNEPAPNPNLRLFHAEQKRDVLVAYDEIPDPSTKVRRRAYYLYEFSMKPTFARKPSFVDPQRTNHLQEITLVAAPASASYSPNTNLYAITESNGTSFTLNSEGRQLSSHELPVYPSGLHRGTQIALTPAAVFADTVMACSIIGLIVWAQGGFWNVH